MSEIPNMATFVDRNTIAYERSFPDQVERVWSAITVNSELDQGCMNTQLDLRVGGAFSFELGWYGWIAELNEHHYVQFNSSDESFTRFEVEPAREGTLLRLTDKLGSEFVPEVRSRQDTPVEDSDTEQMRMIEYNQPGGPGTHWTGVVAGWHGFVDALESCLTGKPPGESHNKLCLVYDRFLTEYFSH